MVNIYTILKNKLINQSPTQEQLEKINEFRPSTFPELMAEEVCVLPVIASSNLIHEDFQKWTISTMESMVLSYQSGKSYTESHDWRDLSKVKGFIFDAEIWEYKNPPSELIEHLLFNSPTRTNDLQIIQEEGLLLSILYIALEKNNTNIMNDLRYVRRHGLSIGGFLQQENNFCPLCSNPFEKILFQDERCIHIMPTLFIKWFWDYLDPDTQALVAPYIIVEGIFDMEELSNVMAKGNRQARIISSRLANLLT